MDQFVYFVFALHVYPKSLKNQNTNS